MNLLKLSRRAYPIPSGIQDIRFWNVSTIQTLGAAATSANVPLEEQLAIVGMLQATMSGSEAGTKYKAFFRSAAKAGEELGLKFTDTNNHCYRCLRSFLFSVASSERRWMQRRMQLQKAFGTDEAVALIDLLYNKTGELQDNILLLYDSMGQGADIATRWRAQ
ncbi:phage tail tape measure protein [Paenibacillus melissococcoides]|uniref:phage tail tape measure protein n=1 Tax=Paenibacillus melissococcoides TaxID=2912268 RepID=UPI0021C3877E|nr:phage tail tape measure protein [Paenibacillus melissococcoides]CAH8722009.1 phage tail tape measure protein [Paenibacillus melissococcoides]